MERTSVLLANHGLYPGPVRVIWWADRNAHRQKRQMRLAGMVYDSVHGAAPWTGMAYGYVTLDTMEWLGLPRTFNELHVLVADTQGCGAYRSGGARR